MNEKLSHQTLRNSSYTFIAYLWPIIFSIIITPIIIFKLGVKDYGIYIFVNTIVSFLGLLDLGIAAAVTKYMATYYGANEESNLKSLIYTAHSLFFLLGLTGFIFSLSIYFWGANLLPFKFQAYSQYSFLFLIGGATFFVNAAVTVYNTIPNVLQRFDISSKVGVVSVTASGLIMLLIVEMGGRLNEIFLAQFLLTIIFSSIMIYFSKKLLPTVFYKLNWDKEKIVMLYSFGLVAFLNNVANSALTYLDRLIIPFFVGPSNLTYYSVPGNVTTKIPGVSNNISATLFPLTSQFEGQKNLSGIRSLYVRSFRLITVVSAALTITTIAFAYDILLYWLNADFANKSSQILIILSVTNFILALSGPLSNFLLGLGKLKILSIVSVIMAGINGLLLLTLLPKYGIVGAAWAYLISVLPVFFIFYYTEKKYLMLSGRRKYYLQKIAYTLITSLVVWVFDYLFLSLFISNLATLVIAGAVSFLLYIILYKFLNFFEQEDWSDLENFFFRIIGKFNSNKNIS